MSVDTNKPLVVTSANNTTALMTVETTGQASISGDTFQISTSKTPASSGAAGQAGQIAWDGGYIYVCIGPNLWMRAQLQSF